MLSLAEEPKRTRNLKPHRERHAPSFPLVDGHKSSLDFQRELAAHHGSAFSVAPILTQSAWFRPHNRDARIPNLYLVGAGTHPGAGVPGVVNSAKATVTTLLEDLGR